MQTYNLADWLAWMEAHHPRQIELGLERVAAVAARLTLDLSGARIVTVGGTNGKGSCVAFLEAILRTGGYRVGAYTSPHLLHYNERVRIDGSAVDDAPLCAAFSAVHAALADTSLTYFEFGTLAALWLFQRAALDVIILEVGLGGRLDAVNLIDADVAVLTTIDLDHQDWLGSDREAIGAEKAGIFRAHKAAVCADENPPRSVIAAARKVDANWYPSGSAFQFIAHEQNWNWSSQQLPRRADYDNLPLPTLPLPSAAAALAALHCLSCAISIDAIRTGLCAATLPGRFQRVRRGDVEVVLDVAHNPQAARWLAQQLAQTQLHRESRTLAVFAIMADKDVDAVIAALKPCIDAWYFGALPNNSRALVPAAIDNKLRVAGIEARTVSATIGDAYNAALAQARVGDRVVVFGSFFTVAVVLAQLQKEGMVDGG
ncbi:MAG TPA: bifunctional tetrahydrofolate synthase/dihydrofolate synthase [Spongiibacteraceae bacterium]